MTTRSKYLYSSNVEAFLESAAIVCCRIWPSSWIRTMCNSSPFQKGFGATDNVKNIRIAKEAQVLDCGCQEPRPRHSSTPICRQVN